MKQIRLFLEGEGLTLVTHFIGNENIQTNIFRIEANNSIMCKYFCIRLIEFMLAGKTLIDYINLLLPHDFEKK